MKFRLLLFLMVFSQVIVSAQKDSVEVIYELVEKMPVFIECKTLPQSEQEECSHEKFQVYIIQNLRWPQEFAATSVQGIVYIEFVVNSKGEITEPKILRGVHPKLDEEALRLINNLPKYAPGERQGEVVSVKLIRPVTFNDNQVLKEDDKIYEAPEIMPIFQGCEGEILQYQFTCSADKFFEYLTMNVRYPGEAVDAGQTGTVYVDYIVDKEGQVTDAKIFKGCHESLEKEALRVINNLPKYTPGRQDGKNVAVSMRMPIVFSYK